MRRATRSGLARAAMFAITIAFGAAEPGNARAENLADALVSAYNNSGLLEQNRALLRAADEDVAIAVAALRPILDWSASVTRQFLDGNTNGLLVNRRRTSVFLGLTGEWTFFDDGARSLGVQAAKESVLATRQTLISIEQQVLLRAVAAYMSVIFQAENVALRQNNLRLLNEELRATQDRFEVGEVTRTDVALAQSRVANARSNLASARGDFVNAQAEFTNAVGRAPGNLSSNPPLPGRPASLDAAQAVASSNHPDILAVQRQVATAELQILQAKRSLSPRGTVRADVGVTENYNSPNYTDDVRLSLNFGQRIYQGGALNAQIRRAIANRDAQRGNLLTIQRNVLQDVADAYVRLEVAAANLAATGERVRAADVAFVGIREEATLGARTTLDVLTAEQDLLDARTAQLSAQAEQYIAAYELLSAQGLLTAERLGLAVQIYDPTIYYNLAKQAPSGTTRQSKDLDRVLRALGKK